MGFLWGKFNGALAIGVLGDVELKSMLKYAGKYALWGA